MGVINRMVFVCVAAVVTDVLRFHVVEKLVQTLTALSTTAQTRSAAAWALSRCVVHRTEILFRLFVFLIVYPADGRVATEVRRAGVVKALVGLLAPSAPADLLCYICIALGSCACIGTRCMGLNLVCNSGRRRPRR